MSRAGTLLLLCAVCVLSGGAIAVAASDHHRRLGDAPSCTSPVAVPGGPGHQPIAGWAFIGHGYELSDATVSLWTVNGRRIPGGSTRTGTTGGFVLSPRARDLPPTFVVTVRGRVIGRYLRLARPVAFSALVHRRALRRIVYVGLVSTVLLDYLRAHPRLAEGKAARRVRRVLGIPAWHNLGYDLYNISARWYSAATIMRAAAARGGMSNLVKALLRAVDRGGPSSRSPLAAAAAAPTAHAAADFDGAWFLEKLAGGVVSAAAGEGAGWVFDQIGFSSTPAYVGEIEAQLSQLAAQMSQLKDAVSDLNKNVEEAYFAQQQNTLSDARGALDTAMEDLDYIPTIADDTAREYWSQQAFCDDIKPLATNQKPWGSTRVLINNALVNPPPGEKPLGYQAALYLESQSPFWTSTDSQNLWQIVNFWTQYAVEALDVYLDYQHGIAAEQYCDNPPTYNGCRLQAEVELTDQLGNNALATLTTSGGPNGTPLKPMPDGYAIDTRTGLMWCTFCWPAVESYSQAVSGLANGWYADEPVLQFKDMTIPSLRQLGDLLKDCRCSTNQPTGIKYLVDKAGLASTWLNARLVQPNLPSDTHSAKPPPGPGVFVWSSDPVPPPDYLDPLWTVHAGSYLVYDPSSVVSAGEGPAPKYGEPMYYLPVRVPAPAEGPFYP